jgi:hypothetical protein
MQAGKQMARCQGACSPVVRAANSQAMLPVNRQCFSFNAKGPKRAPTPAGLPMQQVDEHCLLYCDADLHIVLRIGQG